MGCWISIKLPNVFLGFLSPKAAEIRLMEAGRSDLSAFEKATESETQGSSSLRFRVPHEHCNHYSRPHLEHPLGRVL